MPTARDPSDGHEHAMERLTEQLDSVGQELAGIRETLDTIRDDIAWWLKNQRREQWLPVQPITSMPVDPAAPDWADRLNRFTAADLSNGIQQNQPDSHSASAAPVPVEDGIDDESQFCCDGPDLQWMGNPELPGVACQNCGYIVADCGSVVMQPSPQADPEPEPKEQQRNLFAEE
jgi:hypothetical protein